MLFLEHVNVFFFDIFAKHICVDILSSYMLYKCDNNMCLFGSRWHPTLCRCRICFNQSLGQTFTLNSTNQRTLSPFANRYIKRCIFQPAFGWCTITMVVKISLFYIKKVLHPLIKNYAKSITVLDYVFALSSVWE